MNIMKNWHKHVVWIILTANPPNLSGKAWYERKISCFGNSLFLHLQSSTLKWLNQTFLPFNVQSWDQSDCLEPSDLIPSHPQTISPLLSSPLLSSPPLLPSLPFLHFKAQICYNFPCCPSYFCNSFSLSYLFWLFYAKIQCKSNDTWWKESKKAHWQYYCDRLTWIL